MPASKNLHKEQKSHRYECLIITPVPERTVVASGVMVRARKEGLSRLARSSSGSEPRTLALRGLPGCQIHSNVFIAK
jgi:hypothetical protein